MTSKPETVSQEAWTAAENALDNMLCNSIEASGTAEQFRADSVSEIALAIMAAEKRGEEREREECSLIADSLPIGNLIQTNETDLKRLWKWAGSAQAGAIAAAIRKRAGE